jgi:hypothetical protein
MNIPEHGKTSVSEAKEESVESIKEISAETEKSQSGLTELIETIHSIKNEIPHEQIETKLSKLKNEARDDAVEKIPTLNEDLAGSTHPETKIPYNEKTVEGANAEKIEGVFPDFSEHTVFDTQLPDDLHLETDKKQSDYCNDKLTEAYDSGDLDTDKFSESQIEQIKNGDKPDGYTWHHNEEKGKMELVPTNIHSKTGHTGGKSIWGGGASNR